MGYPVTGRNKVMKEICTALGLKHVNSFTLKASANSIVTVEAEFYPEIDGIQQLVPIFKKFYLTEIPVVNEIQEE